MKIYGIALVALMCACERGPSRDANVMQVEAASQSEEYTVAQVKAAVDDALRGDGEFDALARGLAWMVGEACLNTKRALAKNPTDELFLRENCVASMKVAAAVQRDHDVITGLNLGECIRLGTFMRGLILEGNSVEELRENEKGEVRANATHIHSLVDRHATEAARRAYGFCRSARSRERERPPTPRFDSSGTVEL
jgi:hypothetical protein